MSEIKTRASIAPLQSAITVASDGGARIKIDIPEVVWKKHALALMDLRNQEFELIWRPVRQVKRGTRAPEWGDDTENDDTG